MSNIKIDRVIPKQLAVPLTEQELRAFGDDLATVCQNIRTETERQKSLKSELKARLDQLEARQTELASIIGRREEIRDVQVECRRDFNTNLFEEVRLDTGVIIHSRPLAEAEYQTEIEVVARPAEEEDAGGEG